MARADLHVHSRYSDHPTEWFLQRLGASESYTEPEAVYEQARAEGMDFVTITTISVAPCNSRNATPTG